MNNQKTKTQEKYEDCEEHCFSGYELKKALQEQAEELFTQEDLQRIVDQHIQAQKEKFEEVLDNTFDKWNKEGNPVYNVRQFIEVFKEVLNNNQSQEFVQIKNKSEGKTGLISLDKTPSSKNSCSRSVFSQEDLQRIVDQHIQAQKEKFEEVLREIRCSFCMTDDKDCNCPHCHTFNSKWEEALNNQSPQNTIEKSMPRSVTSQDVGIAQKKLGDVSGNEDKTPFSIPLSDKDYIVKGEDRGSNICKCGHTRYYHTKQGCCFEVDYTFHTRDDGYCTCQKFTPRGKK